jgi:glycosyltransferase involved in cell wall biosynthesis
MSDSAQIVSVVIPCYNMGQYIEETVASVLAQTFRAFEILIVDDGSDDPATLAVLNRLSGGVVTLLRTGNQGVAAARNHGIQNARGIYILPLDADDLIEPDFLEKTVSIFVKNPEVGIVSCDAMLFGEVTGIRQLPDFSAERLLSENLLYVTSLFRKSDWLRAGGYRTTMKYGWEDWDFWIAVTRNRMTIKRIPEALIKYRIRHDSRDRSMVFWQKVSMILLIIVRHLKWYLRSPVSMFRLIVQRKRKLL